MTARNLVFHCCVYLGFSRFRGSSYEPINWCFPAEIRVLDIPLLMTGIDRLSIVTLVFFFLSTVFVIKPLKIPIPLPYSRPLHIPIDLNTAPILAIAILWASQCLGPQQIRDGIVGTGMDSNIWSSCYRHLHHRWHQALQRLDPLYFPGIYGDNSRHNRNTPGRCLLGEQSWQQPRIQALPILLHNAYPHKHDFWK